MTNREIHEANVRDLERRANLNTKPILETLMRSKIKASRPELIYVGDRAFVLRALRNDE